MTRGEDEGLKTEGSFCPNCNGPSSFYLFNPTDCEGWQGFKARFYPANCQRCEGPALFMTRFEEDGRSIMPLARVFPPHRNALTCELPAVAQRSYEEALRCDESGAALATVVMVGRTLEAVCVEHFPDSPKMTIFKGIELLHQEGIISDQLKSWADQLRVLRNIGAHATSEDISREDAREALDFLKSILENLYELSPKFEMFLARRSAARDIL